MSVRLRLMSSITAITAVGALVIAAPGTANATGTDLLPPVPLDPGVELLYNGGPVMSSVKVVQVLWGTGGAGAATGQFDPQVIGTTSPNLPNLYRDIFGSPFWSWLDADYNTVTNLAPDGSMRGQRLGAGTFVGQFAITPSIAGAPALSAIGPELRAQIAAGNVPGPTLDATGAPNTYYAVHFPVGLNPTSLCVSATAIHSVGSAADGTRFAFGAMPDPAVTGPACSGNGWDRVVGSAVHELAESATDPLFDQSAWSGSPVVAGGPGGEIADLCEYLDPVSGPVQVGLDTYPLPYLWSNSRQACVGNGPADDFVVSTSARRFSLQSGGAATATVMTQASAGTPGTLTLTAEGLPAGVTAAFNPVTVSAGGSSTVTITAAPGTAVSGTRWRIVATSTSNVRRTYDMHVRAAPAGISNGGFETGTSVGWTGAPTEFQVGASADQPPRSGTYAGYLYPAGSNGATTGIGTISQTFYVPSGSATLTGWVNVFCQGTTPDGTQVTLTDNDTGGTSTLVPRTCSSGGGWTSFTGTVTPGHIVTLTVTVTQTFTATTTAYDTVAIDDVSLSRPAWTVKGFYQPTDMGAVWNTVKGGSTVPLKFEIFDGTTELTSVTGTGTQLAVVPVACATGTTDAVESVVSGSSSLRYDTASGQFIQNWQTPRTPGACLRVTISTSNSPSISALFKLK